MEPGLAGRALRPTTALTRTGNYAALHCHPVMRSVGLKRFVYETIFLMPKS